MNKMNKIRREIRADKARRLKVAPPENGICMTNVFETGGHLVKVFEMVELPMKTKIHSKEEVKANYDTFFHLKRLGLIICGDFGDAIMVTLTDKCIMELEDRGFIQKVNKADSQVQTQGG